MTSAPTRHGTRLSPTTNSARWRSTPFFTLTTTWGKTTNPFAQPFHRENADFFRDYEEFEDRRPVLLYDRLTMQQYVEHCRQKAPQSLAAEMPESLAAPCGFPRKSFSRAELHVYSIRHIQHHAAQLSLRLRLDHEIDTPWVRTGWDDRKY